VRGAVSNAMSGAGSGVANLFNLLSVVNKTQDISNLSSFINNVLLCNNPYNNLTPNQKEFYGLLAIALWRLLLFINDNYTP